MPRAPTKTAVSKSKLMTAESCTDILWIHRRDLGARLWIRRIKVPLFWCKWVRVPNGVMMDKYGMRAVDFMHLAYLDEPFVFAKDVVQVFMEKTR